VNQSKIKKESNHDHRLKSPPPSHRRERPQSAPSAKSVVIQIQELTQAVYYRILERMRECVLVDNYTMTQHATEEAWEDNVLMTSIERTILTGEIVERQIDRRTGEIKYVLRSPEFSLNPLELVVKFGPVGELFIITVYPI